MSKTEEKLVMKTLCRWDVCQILDDTEKDCHKNWDCLIKTLDDYLEELDFINVPLFVKVENSGWRSSGGSTIIDIQGARNFLRHILPAIDCTFTVFLDTDGTTMKIQTSHCDSPMGNGWYIIRKATDSEQEGLD